MNLRSNRIRHHLERHGYRLVQATSTINGYPVPMEPILYGPGGAPFHLKVSEASWDNALAHFFADRSKTGARLSELAAGLGGLTITRGGAGLFKVGGHGPDGWVEGRAPDIDKATSELWRRTYIDLEEP